MKKKLFLGVFIVILVLMPMALKKYIDEEIEDEIKLLEKRGLDLKIIKHKGYFSSQRNFELSIKDVDKFLYYLKTFSFHTDYVNLLIKENNAKKFLKDLSLKGNIQNSNINYFANINVDAYLDSFSSSIMVELSKDKMNPLYIIVEKKLLNMNIIFDNTLNFQYFKLRDIDEVFKNKNTDFLKFKILGQEIKNISKKNKVMYRALGKKFLFKDKKSELRLNNFEYDLFYKNTWEYKENLNIDKIFIKLNNFELKSKNIHLENNSNLKENLYSSKYKIELGNSILKEIGRDISIDKILLDVDFSNLDYKTLRKIQELYLKIEDEDFLKETFVNDNKKFVDELNTLFHKTFKVKIGVNIFNLIDKNSISLKDINIKLDEKVLKNNINLSKVQNIAELMEIIDSDIYISLLKEDLENIVKLNLFLAMILFPFTKEENNKFIFDIKTKKGKIFINGTAL